MRYDKEHKAETRQRIVESAGRRLKRDGIDGSGIATLMKDAGLTNGAFYAHFDAKDDLVAAAVAEQLCQQAASVAAFSADGNGLEQFVRDYLSVGHRDNVADGCPSAALLDEIGRGTPATKRAYTDGLLIIVDVIAAQLAPSDPQSARMPVLTAFGSMVGTLQLARALADDLIAEAVLEQGIRDVLELLGTAASPKTLVAATNTETPQP